MTIIAYINGHYLPAEEAKVSPLDRGFMFGDGVYEVIPVYQSKLLYLDAHIDRLNLSLEAIAMPAPHNHAEWRKILSQLIEKNPEPYQWIYLQVTRGAQLIRDQAIPTEKLNPTIFAVGYPKPLLSKAEQSKGLKAISIHDIRWKYCQIKTTARLAYVLMFQQAKEAGADEAIIVHNGFALEGTLSNLFMVKNGVIITPPKSTFLLSGITRDRILALAKKHRIPYKEDKITEQDLALADELWITSSTKGVIPILKLNNAPVSNEKAGPLWSKMWDYYNEDMANYS